MKIKQLIALPRLLKNSSLSFLYGLRANQEADNSSNRFHYDILNSNYSKRTEENLNEISRLVRFFSYRR